MNPIKRLTSFLKTKSAQDNLINVNDYVGWQGATNTLKHYKHNDYENAYGSIRAIANRFMAIRQYTVDEKGDRTDTVLIDKLYHPNQQMSSVDFREALAVMCLVHSEPLILVWTNDGGEVKMGGEVTPDNIAGFTFIENGTRRVVDGVTSYLVNGKQFSDKEVINLRSVNPYDLSAGFSTAKAATRWTTLDDYIADYQRGFFENGAIPAGEFVIRTKTRVEYEDIVKGLQAKHRGAGKNNNVTYVHDPIDPATNKPVGATIEWVPFNTSNKDLDLKTIFENVNKKIDSAYGVPATIRGVNDAVTYSSAQVDERNFVMNVIEPFAMRVWTKFTHELNRITGGLGVAIVFDLDIPQVADEEKVKAETEKIRLDTIITAMNAGFALPSVIKALELENRYENLQLAVAKDDVEDDNDDVDLNDVVEDSPNPEDVKKAIKDKQLTQEALAQYQSKIEDAADELLRSQINRALESTKQVGDATDEEIEEFLTKAMVAIVALLAINGMTEYMSGRDLVLAAGFSAPTTTYQVSPAAVERYRKYLKTIAKGYSADTTLAIQNVLGKAAEQGLSSAQIRSELNQLFPQERYRSKRLAVTEVNRSGGIGSVEAMRDIADQTGAIIEKSMQSTSGSPCEFCATRIGVWYPVDEVMIEKGAEIKGADGGLFVNNWDNNEGHDLHANGQCVPTYRIGSTRKSVEQTEKLTKQIQELEEKLQDMDGRTKEAKELKSEVDKLQSYIAQLESIIDGQG